MHITLSSSLSDYAIIIIVDYGKNDMVDSIMYQEDGYVFMEGNQPEQLLTESEILDKLENILAHQCQLPQDIAKHSTISAQAQYLLHNYCEFNTDDDIYLQWYVVRWEKH